MSETERLHKLCCNEIHAHTDPECCTLDCWCIVESVAEILRKNEERIANIHCSNCRFFISTGKQTLKLIRNGKAINTDTTIGQCRRHAPAMRSWPVIQGNDWCGDFKRNRGLEVS